MTGHRYLARKPIADIVAAGRGQPARALARPGQHHRDRHRRDHRRRDLRADRHRRRANYAGPAIILSFALAAVACTFVGLCYAELASMLPVSGSTYTYTYATMGELAAWVIGWDLILEYTMGAATVAVGWSGYVGQPAGRLRHRRSRRRSTMPPGATASGPDGAVVHGILNLPAVRHRHPADRGCWCWAPGNHHVLNNVMVSIKLAGRLAFVGVRRLLRRPGALAPVHPAPTPASSAISA